MNLNSKKSQFKSIISRENNFNLIRLFAAFQVVFLHSKGHLNVQNQYLELFSDYFFGFFPGVPIFFVISGFLIYASFERNKNNVKQYLKNRVLRIFPALLVCTILCCGLLLYEDKSFELFSHLSFYKWLLGQLSLFQFYTPDILRFWGVGTPNGSLWTITVEMQFYLIIPILYLLFKNKKYGLYFFVGIVLLSISANWYIGLLKYNAEFLGKLGAVTLAPYLYYFLIGIFIYTIWDHVKHIFHNKLLYWFSAYIIFSIFSSNYLGYKITSYWISSPVNLLADILLSGVIFSAAFSKIDLSKTILKGNDISYGIYIYHMLAVNFFVHHGLTGDVKYLFLVWLLSIFIAYLSWIFIEKPALKLK